MSRQLLTLMAAAFKQLQACNVKTTLNIVYIFMASWLVVWLSGNALVSINIVTLCRARLVPGWLINFGRVNCIRNSHPGQLSLTIRPWVGKMSTRLGWQGNRRSGVAPAMHHRQ